MLGSTTRDPIFCSKTRMLLQVTNIFFQVIDDYEKITGRFCIKETKRNRNETKQFLELVITRR
jgi:hypothetical protein